MSTTSPPRSDTTPRRWAAREPRAVQLIIVALALIGLLDAVIGSNWDLAVILALIGLVSAYGAARATSHRPPVRIRSDLVAWMQRRAASGGERLEDVADRAVGAYRAGIVGEDEG